MRRDGSVLVTEQIAKADINREDGSDNDIGFATLMRFEVNETGVYTNGDLHSYNGIKTNDFTINNDSFQTSSSCGGVETEMFRAKGGNGLHDTDLKRNGWYPPPHRHVPSSKQFINLSPGWTLIEGIT